MLHFTPLKDVYAFSSRIKCCHNTKYIISSFHLYYIYSVISGPQNKNKNMSFTAYALNQSILELSASPFGYLLFVTWCRCVQIFVVVTETKQPWQLFEIGKYFPNFRRKYDIYCVCFPSISVT